MSYVEDNRYYGAAAFCWCHLDALSKTALHRSSDREACIVIGMLTCYGYQSVEIVELPLMGAPAPPENLN